MVDADSGRLEVVRNTDSHHRPQSDHHIDRLKAHDVDVVVCNGVGRRAFAALQEAGIDVLVPEHATVADIVSAMRAGEIRRLSTEEVCGGGRHGYGQENCHAHGPGRRGAASHPLRRRGMTMGS
jgi:predicted Fe-Mo cluster-binding NifX family protein